MKYKYQGIAIKGLEGLDGKPAVLIITGIRRKSKNPKTGLMIQSYILPDNGIPPHVNAKTGQDVTVCGDCKHRPVNQDSCYVVKFHGPLAVWKAYTERSADYLVLDWNTERFTALEALRIALHDRNVRLGSYGDPAVIPLEILRAIKETAAGTTGYTHQWKTARHIKGMVQASVDNVREYKSATKQGWRTFRVGASFEERTAAEMSCPASKEMGAATDCNHCGLCSGERKNVFIKAHGLSAAKFDAASA